MLRWVHSTILVILLLTAGLGCRRDGAAADAASAGDPAGAQAAAEALAACEVKADRDCVAKHLDLDMKAGVLLGALYQDGTADDRKATRTMLLDLFMAAGPKLRERHFEGGVGTWTVETAGDDDAVVVEAGAKLRLEYRVTRTVHGWRVADRIRVRGEHRADPKVLVNKFLKDFEVAKGQAATLDDVNRDLPGFLGTHRARTLRIPERKKKGGTR